MASQISDMMFYWASGSPYCWRAMIALEEKGLNGYPNKLLSFEEKTVKVPEVLKLNHRGQVPTFRHGTVVVSESMAICEYLEQRFKSQGTSLIPTDAARAALVRQRQYETENLVQKLVKDLVFYAWSKDAVKEKVVEKEQNFAKELNIWEGYLKEQGKDSYLAGPEFTMADVAAYPFIAFAVRLGLKLQPRMPLLASYYERVSRRPSVQASWPPHWKESPAKDLLANVLD